MSPFLVNHRNGGRAGAYLRSRTTTNPNTDKLCCKVDTRQPRAYSYPITMSVPRDVQEFLEEYPDLVDDSNQSDNLLFYQNKLRCRPDRKLIDEIHEEYGMHTLPKRSIARS